MPLSPRLFHTLTDVANHWSVMPIDIIDWAIDGLLELSFAAPQLQDELSNILCGLVEVGGVDVRKLFLPNKEGE